MKRKKQKNKKIFWRAPCATPYIHVIDPDEIYYGDVNDISLNYTWNTLYLLREVINLDLEFIGILNV